MNNISIKEKTKTLNDNLQKMMPQLKQALPTHMKPERLLRISLNAVQNNPKLLECDQRSFCLAILRAAQLGLEPDGVLGQAYLIPFKNYKNNIMEAQFIIGYKGLIDLARRSGEVSSINAKEVCENDDFCIEWHNEIPFTHKQTLSNRGKIIGFWAKAHFKDGGFLFDFMSVEEVNEIRDNSQGYKMAKKFAKNGNTVSPWVSNYAEMGKKTIIRRIAKFLPMNVQKAALVDQMNEEGKKFDMLDGDIVIDNDANDNQDLNAALQEAQAQEKVPAHDEDGVIIEETKPADHKKILEAIEGAKDVETIEKVKATNAYKRLKESKSEHLPEIDVMLETKQRDLRGE